MNFENFFRTGLKTACLRGSEEGGNAFDSLGTHKGGGRLARYAEGTNWTLADGNGHGRTLGDKPKLTGSRYTVGGEHFCQ